MNTCRWCRAPISHDPDTLAPPPAGLTALRRFVQAAPGSPLGSIAPADGWRAMSEICEECWWPLVRLGERVSTATIEERQRR